MSSNQESENLPPEPAVSAEELLPPVEPPSARFILQLFVVPALIVLAVVVLWLLVTTVATRGAQDPDKIVKALRSSNQARWQKAMSLAEMLNNPRHAELKRNSELAGGLAELLDEEIDAKSTDDNSIQLRYFLCRVLGEFHVDDGSAVLLKAARQDVERDVRREAINALAVLAHSLHTLEEPQALKHEELVSTFTQLAAEEDNLLRSQAAFALGIFSEQPGADPRFTSELELLVDDLFADARYNAALALARHGNGRAMEALVEMLDPEAIELSIAGEQSPALKTFKCNTILRNALDGIDVLLQKNVEVDRSELLDAVSRFVENAANWQVAGEIPEALIQRGEKLLQKHSASRVR
ncbi:MAG: HEAT repeat domain-containing protein [Pirellulales bacterium]|nr:HEAT repeat domain-containing protein [Pirellulales bacterium]